MIDLILYAPDKETMREWGKTNPPARPLRYLNSESVWQTRDGLEWSWWGGNGQFMTAAGSSPTYAPGVVMRMRVHGEFFDWDRIDTSSTAEWARSKIAQYVKDNGTSGTMSDIPFFEISSVRLFLNEDVQTFISSRGLPGHVFL